MFFLYFRTLFLNIYIFEVATSFCLVLIKSTQDFFVVACIYNIHAFDKAFFSLNNRGYDLFATSVHQTMVWESRTLIQDIFNL